MTYEQSTSRWVATRFDVEGAADVRFEAYDTEGYCNTCDYGREQGITVTFNAGGQVHTKDLPDASVSDLVREIVNA